MIKLKFPAVAAIALAGVFGGIAVASAFGWWVTESTKQPVKIKQGEFAGMPDPGDIRGSYSWNDVSKAFGLPAKTIMAVFGAEDPDSRVSTLEGAFEGLLPEEVEVGTDSVRLFVALYAGLPHDPEASTVLPAAAIPVLSREGKADAGRIAEAASKAVELPVAGAAGAGTEASKEGETDHAPAAGTVVGKTTFGDLRAWGYDMAAVEKLVGGLGKDGVSIRDFCAEKGIEFSSVKAQLQSMMP